MVSPVCTTTDPNNPGKMQFHVGTDHSNEETATGQVCITAPGSAEICFNFDQGYPVETDPEDYEGNCIVGQMQENFPSYTADALITCYSGAEFVDVNDAPNSNPVQATSIPTSPCDTMYPGRGSPLVYMFTAEVSGAESGTYYIRTQYTDQVMNPCYDTANPAVESDDYTCAPGSITYVINMAVAEEGASCETAPPQAAGTVEESYVSCQPPNAFNGFVCPVLCADDASMTGILKCNEGAWEDSIVCVGAATDAPTADPTNQPTDAPTMQPTPTPTEQPTTLAPTFVPTQMPTQSPIPCATSQDNDIIFVLDSSTSVENDEWTMMLEFVEETVLEFIPDNSRIAVTAYSTDGYLHFDLETYGTTTTDRAVLAAAVLETPKISGSTHTLSGLEFAFNNVIAPQSVDGRVSKLFLLTDGASAEDTCSIVKTLQDSNVHVTIVTIGDDYILETHYDCLVNAPEDHIILGRGFEAMESIFAPMEDRLCAEKTSFPSMPPTFTPTVQPTANPTQRPTAMPTRSPTTAPTDKPTAAPTPMPTGFPTAPPSTITPTVSPTAPPTSRSTTSTSTTSAPRADSSTSRTTETETREPCEDCSGVETSTVDAATSGTVTRSGSASTSTSTAARAPPSQPPTRSG